MAGALEGAEIDRIIERGPASRGNGTSCGDAGNGASGGGVFGSVGSLRLVLAPGRLASRTAVGMPFRPASAMCIHRTRASRRILAEGAE